MKRAVAGSTFVVVVGSRPLGTSSTTFSLALFLGYSVPFSSCVQVVHGLRFEGLIESWLLIDDCNDGLFVFDE